MLGLYHGERGGRLWRQVWSNHKLKPQPPREVMHLAREALARGAEVPAKEVPV
jgi:tRNA-dihydrouridine synthase A